MFWRKFKLDWGYAVGELVIVTLGVLVALGIQQWNEGRLEREEEKAILGRLLTDLDADEVNIAFLISTSEGKLEMLARLKQTFSSGRRPAEPAQFLKDVVNGAELGWQQNGARHNTFDEILSSGKLGLIRHDPLRDHLSRYYAEFESLIARTDERESEFPNFAYKLVPRQQQSRRAGDSFLGLSNDLSNQEIESVIDLVLASPIRDHVVGEMNVAHFILSWATRMRSERQDLVIEIQDYQATLEN
jgi:hypothetical protein